MSTLTPTAIWQALEDIKDPEIPVISVVELGIVRDVEVNGERVTVTITPTFAGCPALHVLQNNIRAGLQQLGAAAVEVPITLSPPWSSDWITPEGKARLKAFGLSPPRQHNGQIELIFHEPVQCPYCDSFDTSMKNSFGSTACRAIHYCNNCSQPFEQFKPL
ncbi:MAG: 1,2-phenylacetyl-CoA epoxidase subunit PaaD [Anaerolineales bacterium]